MRPGAPADKADPLSTVQVGYLSVGRSVTCETGGCSDARHSVTMGIRPMNWNEWIEVRYTAVGGRTF